MNLKTVLITLSIVAVVLIGITFYVVFYSGTGTYVVSSLSGSAGTIFGNGTPVASSTPSSTLVLASSSVTGSASSTDATGTLAEASGTTPIIWTQGSETMTITDAALTGSQLTLGVQVAMGPIAECVPLNLRMIADEQGDLSPPATPQFTFPDTGTCNGTPGETYSAQPIVFTLPTPATFPIILTTGGVANILFEVAQNPDGSVAVQLPPNSD